MIDELQPDDATVIAPRPSVFTAVQQHWQKHAGEWQLDLDVPGTGGLLVLRTRPIESRALATLLDRINTSKDPLSALNANVDLLVAATDAVLGRDRPGDTATPTLDPDGDPYTIGTLAGPLGMNGARAREVCLRLFSGVPSPDLAIGQTANEYIAWASGANLDIDASTVGESPAGG